MKRLLWLSHLLPHPPQSGALQRSHRLILGAAQQFDVDLVTFRQQTLHRDDASVAQSVEALGQHVRVQRVFDLPSEAGVWARRKLQVASQFGLEPYTVRWNRDPALDRYLKDLVARETYDVVHFDTIGMMLYRDHFPEAAWVLNHHNVESHMMRRRAELASPLQSLPLLWEAWRLGRWERLYGGQAALHLVVSELDGQRLREIIPGAAVDVIENPADTEYFRTANEPVEPGSVVFTGQIDTYANVGAVRWLRDEIWPLLRERGLAETVWIVGRNPDPDIVAWGENDDSVRVTGFVDDIRPWLDRASIYLCPIRDGGGTRLKLLDAMCMALPIVTHPLGAEGLDLEDGVNALFATTPEEFAGALERLAGDAELARSLGRAARRHVEERFSSPVVHERLHRAYERALTLRRAGRS